MERGNGPPLLSNFIQLLSFLPAGVLAFLSWNAFDYYNLGVDMMRYEHTNIYGSLLIGWVVWTVAAGVLVAMLLLEAILQMHGRGYDIPPVALIMAGTWNFFLGFVGASDIPLPCGLGWPPPPEKTMSGVLYLTAITFGLLLAGMGAIKHKSFRAKFGEIAAIACFINGVLAALGALSMILSLCLASS